MTFRNMRVLRFDDCEHITKIPNLSSAPKLEVLSFAGCKSLTEIHESVGSLDKLKTLDASECSQLKSLPPLKLPSLGYLGLHECSSLESFPKISAKNENMTSLSLYCVPIKKFPYSIHNLTRLRSLDVDGGGIVELPIKLLEQVETLWFRDCKGLLLRNEDDGEEQVSSMSFSNKTELRIDDCNISEEFFRIALPMFPRLQSLHLQREYFRILPECIEELQFLRKIHLIDCEKLEEIRGIPPNIEELFVSGCTSWSLLKGRMLLNKKLHEDSQDGGFILPWNRLPMWFDHQRRESSITFWFRNKFPAISFGFFFPSVHTGELVFHSELTINGAKSFPLGVNPKLIIRTTRDGLVFIFNKTQTIFRDKVDEVLLENEWHCAVFSVHRSWRKQVSLKFIEVGVHIIKEKSCMDDVRFTDPNGNSNSKRMSSTTTNLNVQDRGAVLNSDSNSDSESLVGSEVEQPLDDAYNNSFSNKKELDIYDCIISEEFLRIILPMSPRLQSLCLRSQEFNIVPECIGKFQFLRRLRLIDCMELEEIRGIPPNIEELFVVNCRSLSALTREMLLDQKLHEEGQDKMFILPEPGERLPMWFEYRRRDLSIAFWFRNKFPAISFGLFTWSDPLDQSTIRPRLTINGAKSFQLVAHDYESLGEYAHPDVGHILIFSKTQTTFRDQVGEALSENEWQRAVIDVYDDEPFNGYGLDSVQVGIHIIKEKSCMDDIRFTDPLSQKQCDTLRDGGYSHEAHTQSVQQQTYSARFLEWQCDTVKFRFNPNDMMSSYATNPNVQDLQEEQNFRFWYKQEEQNLTSIDQHKLEGCESFVADNGKNPLTELLSTTKPEQLVMLDLSRNCSSSVQVAELLKKKFENMRVLKFDYCKHIKKIPNLSSAPKLEVLSFVCCYGLTEIDESVGSLDKLKTLDAFSCRELRSLPPLKLPSLKYLNLKFCLSLESFPEILAKNENMKDLSLRRLPVKKLPYSIHKLTGLQSLSLEFCGAVELLNCITLPGVKRLSFNFCDDLLLPNQDEGEGQVSSMPVSNTAFLRIYGGKISEEFLRVALPMFPRLQFLCLGWANFRILPECIGEFQFLRRLHLIACENLEEIRGIPPNIEELRVSCCGSLSWLTREMLLNKKLYEEGQDKRLFLAGNGLPVWFEHQRRESSITFWFRNKFPAISFGVLSPSTARFIRAKLTINGTKSFQLVQYHPHREMGQGVLICIFSKTQRAFRDQVDEALSENDWNRAVFSVDYDVDRWDEQNDLGWTVEVGVHIIMDDIRFTDPLLQKECDTPRDMGYPQFGQLSSTTATTLNVQEKNGSDNSSANTSTQKQSDSASQPKENPEQEIPSEVIQEQSKEETSVQSPREDADVFAIDDDDDDDDAEDGLTKRARRADQQDTILISDSTVAENKPTSSLSNTEEDVGCDNNIQIKEQENLESDSDDDDVDLSFMADIDKGLSYVLNKPNPSSTSVSDLRPINPSLEHQISTETHATETNPETPEIPLKQLHELLHILNEPVDSLAENDDTKQKLINLIFDLNKKSLPPAVKPVIQPLENFIHGVFDTTLEVKRIEKDKETSAASLCSLEKDLKKAKKCKNKIEAGLCKGKSGQLELEAQISDLMSKKKLVDSGIAKGEAELAKTNKKLASLAQDREEQTKALSQASVQLERANTSKMKLLEDQNKLKLSIRSFLG